MMNKRENVPAIVALLFSIVLSYPAVTFGAYNNLARDLQLTWGEGRCILYNNNQLLSASLDKASGSGFESKDQYLFVKMDMQIKLVRGNSAGTVTTYYLSSKGQYHDEIDFEFLGNVSGDPYTVHTNVYCGGVGNREQQFRLPFDPTADFHTYSIHWTPQHILFLVDGIPIREYKNNENRGICFPKSQPMKMYSSIWNADDWATRGGLVKTDWSKGPFKAWYRNFNTANACIWKGTYSLCRSNNRYLKTNNNAWLWQSLSNESRGQMKWMQSKYMVYNYCKDKRRFPNGFAKECYIN